MSEERIEITVNNKEGLHLRPAALFVQEAAHYAATIRVRNITKNTAPQDAKSALGVMMLRVVGGETIEITASGSDAPQAVRGLATLVESNFAER